MRLCAVCQHSPAHAQVDFSKALPSFGGQEVFRSEKCCPELILL